jgi:hypothetical protein
MYRFALLSAVILCASASAAVITFEDIGVPLGTQTTTAVNGSQNSGGFTFVSAGADLHFHHMDGFGDNGTTNMGAHGFVDFSPMGGGIFSLQSFMFDYFTTDLDSVTVIGTKSGGGSVSQTFKTDGIPDLLGGASSYQTFALNSTFTNLTSVRIDSGVANSTSVNGFFVDNIAVNSVPEPASIALMGAGLLCAGLVRRRRA